jgi:streptogramin lyase
MRLTRPLALATAVAALTLLTAVPASAAPPALPDGWQLVNITCPSDSTAVIMTVDSATGASTPVASAPADAECGYSGAWDRVTGAAYFTSSDLTTSLLKYDSATGTVTKIAELSGDSTDATSMAIDLAGNAYILNDGGLYSLDLTTGVTTTVADLLEPTSYVYGFSVDPRTGDLYLLDEVGDLYLIDPSQAPGTGVDTFVASWSFPNGGSYTWGLAIDGNGTAWVTDNSSTIGYVSLLSVPLDSFGSATPEYSGELLEDGLYYDAWWVTLIPAPAPEPQLAATGLDVSTGLATGALVLLAGFGVVMVARRRTA